MEQVEDTSATSKLTCWGWGFGLGESKKQQKLCLSRLAGAR